MSLEYLAKNASRHSDELRRRIDLESRQVHAVLKATGRMTLNPSAPVPYGRIVPTFLTWLLRFAAIPIGFAVAVCLAAYAYNELTLSSAVRVFEAAIVYGGSLAAILSLIIAGTARMLVGEQIAHDAYLARVRHDYENAVKLIGYGEGTLKQAAALVKRQIDYVGDVRIFFLSLLGGFGALTFSILAALEVPKSFPLYGDAARFAVLCGLLVVVGYFYSFKSLPSLRYQMSVIELAQQLEREPEDAGTTEHEGRLLKATRRAPLRTLIGLISYLLVGRLSKP